MNDWLRASLVLLPALWLSACFFRPVDTLRTRASYDIQCGEDKLTFTEIGGDCGKKLANDYTCTIGVRGCGKQATYIHVPKADWVMNSEATAAPAPAP